MLDVAPEAIEEASPPPVPATPVSDPKKKGLTDPSVATPRRSSRLAPAEPAVVVQAQSVVQAPAVAQPKRRGRPPKPGMSIIFLNFFFKWLNFVFFSSRSIQGPGCFRQESFQ